MKDSSGKEKNEQEPVPNEISETEKDDMRLNRFISHAGVASRRKASELIRVGEIQVNGEVITNPGHRVVESDVITYKGKELHRETEMIYLLMNKPKDCITTVTDDRGRKTVMDILPKNLPVRIFPVGRLDRNTTGLLLLTNDGELAQRLIHPRHQISKVYEAVLDQELKQEHLALIRAGITLEDGQVEVDAINFIHKRPKNEVALEIHLGRNRIVRRIFEHFGYQVIKLDRTRFGTLTKKDLGRGRFRHLSEKEVIRLKFL
jgi:23S rRNA pseudouridine2605 synthase